MAHFNRERVTERVVHAKGAGSHGLLTVTHDLSRHNRARLFAKAGTTTPVCFVCDAQKLGDSIHSRKRDPTTGPRCNTMQWDFWSLSPESRHQVPTLFSDRGIPAALRHMNGLSSHTCILRIDAGERHWLTWHFKTMQGIKTLSKERAANIAGADLDFHRRDLRDAIARGDFPKWKVQVQRMPELDADTYRIHPFDLTKVRPHADHPLIDVGVFELKRNPENHFAKVEQAAFAAGQRAAGHGGFARQGAAGAANVLPGRAPRPHRHQLAALPINRPHVLVPTDRRDGRARFERNDGQKAQLVADLATPLKTVPRHIRLRQLAHVRRADADKGARAATALGLSMDEAIALSTLAA